MYKVFIVDDEPFIVEGLYDIVDWPLFELEVVGHAENGAQALEMLRTTPVDLLITDISMPIMNGLQLISEVRKLHKDLKVIILSGFNEFDYLKQAMLLGIENYLLKPINVEELESTLRNTMLKLDSPQQEELYSVYDIRIVMDNLLNRWLKGQIAETEFRERADMLGLQLDGPYAAVCAIRTSGYQNEVLDRVNQFLSTREDKAAVCRDVDGDLILIGSLSDQAEGRIRFHQLAEDLARELSIMKCTIHMGVGKVRSLFEEASLSYKEAKRALEYYMVYPDRLFIDYAQLQKDVRQQPVLIPLSWEEYSRMILAKDADSLKGKIREDFTHLQKLEGIRPEDLQNAALEMVIRFKMEIQSIKHTSDEEDFKHALDRVQQSQSFSSLLDILEDTADAAVHMLVLDSKSPVVQQVLNYIHNHYADEMSLKTMGSLYNIHPVYLGQLFHKETGSSFAEYINKYRIDRAKELLKHTNQKVHEIARHVGYWETGYFYKQFRRYVGISPTDYKALN